MKNLSIFFAALVAVLFSVTETNAQITPSYYNPANVRITGGTINGTTVGATTAAAVTSTIFSSFNASNSQAVSFKFSNDTRYYHDITTLYSATPASSALIFNINTGSVNTVAEKLRLSAVLNTSVNPLSVTDTTDSSSTTTGSLKTAGGLGVAKKAYFGDFIVLTGAKGIYTDNTISYTHINGGSSATLGGSIFLFGESNAGTPNEIQFRNSGNQTRGKFNADGTFQVGSGSGTSAGLIAGYHGVSGFGSIWSTGVTPSTSNYSFTTNVATTRINGSGNSILSVGGNTILDANASNITHVGNMIYDKTITTPGTTGAVTINKTTGRVNFAAAATSLVVTNSLATANSICHVTKATNDATMRLGACVAAAGSITIYADVAPAAETAVNFTVTN